MRRSRAEQEMGSAHRAARSSISSEPDERALGLFLSEQPLFEALPPFGIEIKMWLCASYALMKIKHFLALFRKNA
jgi:hypothetical protein